MEKVKLQLSVTVGCPKTIAQESETISGGAIIVGVVVSITVTFWTEIAKFPALSVTVQVTVVIPVGKLEGASWVTLATEQLSEEVGSPKSIPVATQELLDVEVIISAGATLIGAVVSETVTNWMAETIFPELSVTCHTTGVTPIEKSAGALLVRLKTPQLSVADATPIVTEQFPEKTSGGKVNTGSSLSTTVIFWDNLVVLLALSVTIHVNIFSPSTNNKFGLSFSIETMAQLSVAVTVPVVVNKVVQLPVSVFTIKSGGRVTVGVVVSLGTTVTLSVTLNTVPSESVAETVTIKVLDWLLVG